MHTRLPFAASNGAFSPRLIGGLALLLAAGCTTHRPPAGAGSDAAASASGVAAGNPSSEPAGAGAGKAVRNAPAGGAGNAGADSHQAAASLYVDREYGFSITVPAHVQQRDTFSPGVLDGGQWRYGSSAPTTGSARVALVLPGSNNITTGELRVGVGAARDSVKLCTQVPAGAEKQPGTITLDRVGFTSFRQQDAAMNHYMTAESFRAVRKDRCYAIDLLVYGTNPQVYDPPATPPFTREQAMQQLRNMLPGFRFLQ